MRCFWCNTDPVEAAARHEGAHATWCAHYEWTPQPGLKEMAAALRTKQEPLGTEFERVLFDNLWDLYAR